MYISAATTENSMKITQDIFFKKLPFYPTIPLMCLSKENKTNFQKKMHLYVHCSLICNYQDTEAI